MKDGIVPEKDSRLIHNPEHEEEAGDHKRPRKSRVMFSPPHPYKKGGPHSNDGHGDCRTMDFVGFYFSHLNPVTKPDELRKIISRTKQNSRYLKQGTLTEHLNGHGQKEAYRKSQCRALDVAKVAERLFEGERCMLELPNSYLGVYRIVPEVEEVELVTLSVPLIPTVINQSFIKIFDCSLDILLSFYEDPIARPSIRIPLMRKDRRVPEKEQHNLTMLAVTYDENGEKTRFLESYANIGTLTRGLPSKIAKYSRH